MGDVADTIKYLYEKFILRDVLSFVTPGALVVLTAFLFIPDPTVGGRFQRLISDLQQISWVFYILLFGLFFAVGFAIQCLGEFFGIVYFTPRGQSTWSQRLSIFSTQRVLAAQSWWWAEDDEQIVKFHEEKDSNYARCEWAIQWRERRVITKQLCANNFLAIAIIAIIIGINQFTQIQTFSFAFVSVLVFVLLFSLYWGYRVQVLRQDTITNKILHR